MLFTLVKSSQQMKQSLELCFGLVKEIICPFLGFDNDVVCSMNIFTIENNAICHLQIRIYLCHLLCCTPAANSATFTRWNFRVPQFQGCSDLSIQRETFFQLWANTEM
jgi:hypothetical protein